MLFPLNMSCGSLSVSVWLTIIFWGLNKLGDLEECYIGQIFPVLQLILKFARIFFIHLVFFFSWIQVAVSLTNISQNTWVKMSSPLLKYSSSSYYVWLSWQMAWQPSWNLPKYSVRNDNAMQGNNLNECCCSWAVTFLTLYNSVRTRQVPRCLFLSNCKSLVCVSLLTHYYNSYFIVSLQQM